MSSGTSVSSSDRVGPEATVVRRVSARVTASLAAHLHLAILLIPVVLVSLPFWPGHMNADTLNEISEVRSGHLTDYHGPILLGIWHLFWGAGVGPGWVLVVQSICFVIGAYMLMRVVFGRYWATVAAGVVTILPQSYGELGLLGRDTWYCALLLVTAGTLAWGFAWGDSPSRRRQIWAVAVSCVTGWLALAARQNAVTSMVVVFGAALLLTVALLLGRWRDPAGSLGGRLRRLGVLVVGAIVVTLVFYESQAGVEKAMSVKGVHPEQFIYDFDLVGMSLRENRDLFPHSILPPSKLNALRPYFTLDDISPELAAPAAPLPKGMLNAAQVAAERRAEIKAVEHKPFVWFNLHWDEFLRQMSITREANVIMHPGIDSNPWGLHARFPSLDNKARGYVETFDHTSVGAPQGGILFSVWIYMLAAVGGLATLRYWRNPRYLVVGVLALSSITYQIGAFLSMGVQYRLEYPSVVTGIVVVIMGGRLLRERLSKRAVSRQSSRLATTAVQD